MADTPVARRIKRAYISATTSTTKAEGTESATGSYQFQEDVRIIGFQLRVSGKPESALTEGEGHFYANGVLSPAVGVEDPIFAELPLLVRMNTGTGGNPMCGSWVEHTVVMWPEGYGYDIDTGEYLYVGLTAENQMFDEAVAFACVARVYYVER